jgi:hypothetical protein
MIGMNLQPTYYDMPMLSPDWSSQIQPSDANNPWGMPD